MEQINEENATRPLQSMGENEVTDLHEVDSSVVKAKRLPRSEKKRRRRQELLAKRKEVRKEKKLEKKRRALETAGSVDTETNELDNCRTIEVDSAAVSVTGSDACTDEKTETERRCKGHILRKQRLGEIQDRCKEALVSGQRICVDCSLGSHMTAKECSKLAQQIGRLYGSNRKSKNPLHIYLSGLKKDGIIYMECVRKNTGFESYIMDICEESYDEMFQRDELVYLTPDSGNVLETLDKSKVYVIGGLVDESAKKKLTISHAEKFELKTARFPIDKYMTKVEGGNYKKALTVNQVVDILLAFGETGDWVQALAVGVPKRTGFVVKQ